MRLNQRTITKWTLCHFCEGSVMSHDMDYVVEALNMTYSFLPLSEHKTPVAHFHLHQSELEKSHAEIWQAVYFSLNRGRCGSVTFPSVLCLWHWGAPCRGASTPRQWRVLPSCHTNPQAADLVWTCCFYIIQKGTHSSVSLPAVSSTDWGHTYGRSCQAVHHGCLNRRKNWFCVDSQSLCCSIKD